MIKWLTLLIAGLVILLSIQTCSYRSQKAQISELTIQNQKLDSLKNKMNQTIYKQESIIVENTEALNRLTDTIFNLKKKDSKNRETIAYYKGITKVRIDSVDVPYLDTLAMRQFEDTVLKRCSSILTYMRDSTITVPRNASIANDTLFAKISVLKSGLRIDSLSMVDTLNLRFLDYKGGLFRAPKVELQYFHSNPIFKTEKATSVFYKPKKKSNLIPKALLIAAGIFIGTKL
mgnify:CR=1 FL=1